MQFRPEVSSGPGYSVRRPGAPPFPAGPPFRGGFPVDHGPRVDDRRHHNQSISRGHSSAQKPEDEEAPPSRHLWVGNVSQDISEDVLKEKFSKYGDIESVTVYSQRNYAFINFRKEEDAVDAKTGLQGMNLGGLAMRIEFAKGAKPSRHLWVGGISLSASKEEIEGEFNGFGILENCELLRDCNCAFVDYARLEDAVAAVDALNRKRLGDEELRVDYGRSQPLKRESGQSSNRHQADERSALREHRAGSGIGLGSATSSGGKDKDGEPSEVLWVGFPLYAKVDEDGLRRAFIQFGEIERIKTFPGRTYAFVQFRSVEEATRAKDGLEGKLFNDPRVHIRYSKSEIGPVDNPRDIDSPAARYAEPLVKGVGPTRFTIGSVDRLGAGSPVRPSSPNVRLSNLRPELLSGSAGSGRGVVSGRPGGLGLAIGTGRAVGRGVADARLNLDDLEFQIASAGGRAGLRPSIRHTYEDTWDLPDEDPVSRDQKRPRLGGLYSVGASAETIAFDSFDGRRFAGIEGVNLGHNSDPGNPNYGGVGQPISGSDDYTVQGSRLRLPSLFEGSRPVGGMSQASVSQVGGFHSGSKRDVYGQESSPVGANEGWRWHGTIAKGGTPVCRARCFPVGKGIDVNVPDVVNCTARTDLDMLARHVYQAGDFGVVFFVPEADPDVPPYQDFMHYLGEKHRAGVAKLGDGTTLFLVPPSEFSERVLKVPGNDCLFGVVLKQPPVVFSQTQPLPQQQATSGQPLSQLSVHQHFAQTLGPSSLNGPASQDPPGFRGPSPPLLQGQQSGQSALSSASGPQLSQVQLANLAGQLPAGLTPELIASLTALLPQQGNAVGSSSNSAAGPGVPMQFSQSGAALGRAPAGLVSSNSGANDVRPAFRPPQNLPSQGWHQFQQDQNQASPMRGGFHSHSTGMQPMSEQVSSFHSVPPQQQQQQPPQVQQTQSQPPQQSSPLQQPGVLQASTGSALGGQPFPSVPSPAFPASGFHGQFQPQSRPVQASSAPQLPAEQLAQLTALLTQRQQQPAQQQAAHLLQQHFQQQQPSAASASLSSLPSQAACANQQGLPLQVHTSQPLQQALVSTSQAQWGQHQQSISHQQPPQGSQKWEGTATESRDTPIEQPVVPGQVSGGDGDGERQKRFQATLELAAALLQQMQQQEKPRGALEQR